MKRNKIRRKKGSGTIKVKNHAKRVFGPKVKPTPDQYRELAAQAALDITRRKEMVTIDPVLDGLMQRGTVKKLA